jgi:protein-S-isoprenylcysteine O-methyltransferase Ste14
MAAQTVDARLPTDRPSRSSYWFDIVFGRTVPAIFFSVFLVAKLLQSWDAVLSVPARAQPSDYLAPLDQVLELAYFALIVFLYVTRLPKRAGDARPAVIFVSFFGSFAILAAGILPGVPARSAMLVPSALLVTLGLCYTLWALAYLQRSFSIIPEARRLVTGGPYGLSRHPLYLGEGMAAVGFVVPTVAWAGLLLLLLFGLSQYIRIRAEERVLAREFPEYGRYAGRVPRYLPDPRRLLGRR